MEYQGKLYGKVGNRYFPLDTTSQDYDALVQKVKKLEKENAELKAKNTPTNTNSHPL